MTDRYGWGAGGSFKLARLAIKYSGVADENSSAVKAYLRGWLHWATELFDEQTVFGLDDDDAMLKLGRAMFSHEAGRATPLLDGQILLALKLKRDGNLPPE
jgi:hypothetical protein